MHPSSVSSVAWLRVRLRERLRENSPWLRELRDFGPRAHVSETPSALSLTETKNTCNRATRVTTRVFAQPLAQPTPTTRNHTMSEKKKGRLREQMPGAAALVDELRAMFGQAWVDAALREGLRLQREHAQRVADAGQGPADAWLASQRSQAPALALQEGSVVVGALAGNAPAALRRGRLQ